MKEKLQKLGDYALARAQESSTWRGVVLMATAAGVHVAPDKMDAIVFGGLTLAGALGALTADKKA